MALLYVTISKVISLWDLCIPWYMVLLVFLLFLWVPIVLLVILSHFQHLRLRSFLPGCEPTSSGSGFLLGQFLVFPGTLLCFARRFLLFVIANNSCSALVPVLELVELERQKVSGDFAVLGTRAGSL